MNKRDIVVMFGIATPFVVVLMVLWFVVLRAPVGYIIPAGIVAYLCILAGPLTWELQDWRERRRRQP